MLRYRDGFHRVTTPLRRTWACRTWNKTHVALPVKIHRTPAPYRTTLHLPDDIRQTLQRRCRYCGDNYGNDNGRSRGAPPPRRTEHSRTDSFLSLPSGFCLTQRHPLIWFALTLAHNAHHRPRKHRNRYVCKDPMGALRRLPTDTHFP